VRKYKGKPITGGGIVCATPLTKSLGGGETKHVIQRALWKKGEDSFNRKLPRHVLTKILKDLQPSSLSLIGKE